jgi:hypothetical protein
MSSRARVPTPVMVHVIPKSFVLHDVDHDRAAAIKESCRDYQETEERYQRFNSLIGSRFVTIHLLYELWEVIKRV